MLVCIKMGWRDMLRDEFRARAAMAGGGGVWCKGMASRTIYSQREGMTGEQKRR
jgi:hypothetical protein